MKKFIQHYAIALSLITALGIFVHDMKIDKFTMTALALPVVIATFEVGSKLSFLASDSHTHIERASLSQAVTDLRAPSPRIQPRSSDDKKHLQQRYGVRGSQFFDSYHVPLV